MFAVPGEYTVHLRGSGLWTLSKQIDLEPGPNAIDVEVVRPVALRLQLTTNGEPCEVPGSWWFTVAARPLGHPGSMTARRIAGSSYGKSGGVAAADFEFDAPGRYELVFPPVEDRPFLAPRTIEVDSTRDQVVLIEIQAPR